MSFTYNEDLQIERDWVRFWTGDTVEGEHFLSDALIDALLVSEGSKEKAALAGLLYILSQLNKPNFRADWLDVDYQTARQGYETMLHQLERQFGYAPVLTVHEVMAERVDLEQDERE